MTDADSNPEQEAPVKVDNSQTMMALICHLGGIVLSFIPSLVIYLAKPDEPILRDHSRNALNFQLTVLMAWVAASILTMLGIGAVLMAIVWIANLVFCVIAAIKANQGEVYNYPVALPLIK